MSDLDTDALRKASRAVYLATDERVGDDLSAKLRVAADTIDALRDKARWEADMNRRATEAQRGAEAERDALRRIIADAPHEDWCAATWRFPDQRVVPCDCWKSRIEETR